MDPITEKMKAVANYIESEQHKDNNIDPVNTMRRIPKAKAWELFMSGIHKSLKEKGMKRNTRRQWVP